MHEIRTDILVTIEYVCNLFLFIHNHNLCQINEGFFFTKPFYLITYTRIHLNALHPSLFLYLYTYRQIKK